MQFRCVNLFAWSACAVLGLVSLGCGPKPGETTVLDAGPPTEEERAANEAYNAQMQTPPSL